jgi:hypothetical protein
MASAGTFFLVSYYSTVMPKGLIGWTPGQEVHLDPTNKAADGFVAVTDGTYHVAIHRSMLTQNIDQANALLAADTSAQAQADAVTASVRAQGNAQQTAANMVTAAHVEQHNAQQVASSMIGTYNSRLRSGAYPATGGGYGYYSYYQYVPVVVDSGAGVIVPGVSSASATSASSASSNAPTAARPLPGISWASVSKSAPVVSAGARTLPAQEPKASISTGADNVVGGKSKGTGISTSTGNASGPGFIAR